MTKKTAGFTLIELSIVLVIIGLIVGGVLVGQDLIRAAEVRSTIAQVEKYNTAVNTFRGKYNAVPGDLNASTASAFGFTARGTNAGQGDGNGVLECYTGATNSGVCQGGGETGLFWQDLSSANGLNLNLIDGSFASATTVPVAVATTATANYMPAAKLGRGNFVYVYSANGINYYGMSVPGAIVVTTGAMPSSVSMSPQQAYNIDKKTDDGFPGTGSVTAQYVNTTLSWAGATITASGTITAATAQAATTCYDNGNTGAAQAVYSLGTAANGGNGANCALSYRFQ